MAGVAKKHLCCAFFCGLWMDSEDHVDGSPTVDGRNPANQLIW